MVRALWRYGGGGDGFEMYYLAIDREHTAAILSRRGFAAAWHLSSFYKGDNAGEASFAGVIEADAAKRLSVLFVREVRAQLAKKAATAARRQGHRRGTLPP